MKRILEVKDLEISFLAEAGPVRAIRGISFEVEKGEMLGIVGESGCGKSLAALSLLRLLPPSAHITGGNILYKNRPLTLLAEKELESIRGKEISMIFQDPAAALNPVLSIETQLTEPLLHQRKLSWGEARHKAVETLARVGIPHPENRIKEYPHQFSGGMRQRVLIALAFICNPQLIIADEPTAALDVTIQAQVLQIMKKMNEESQTSFILISHDLALMAEICGRILVMYAGLIVEQGTARDIFGNACHPYTQALIKAIPPPYLTKKERLLALEGQPPALLAPPSGCPFWTRCRYAMIICREQHPPAYRLSPSQQAACWLLHPQAAHVFSGGF